jgi:tetratricopeptide (TPR) repeat protein
MKSNLRVAFSSLALLSMIIVIATPAFAQLDRWNDLTQRVAQLVAQGRLTEALPVARDALSVAGSTFGTAHVNYGISQGGMGYILMLMGNLDEAEMQLVGAQATIESSVGAENINMLYPLANLAQLYYARATASQANPVLMQQHLAKAENYGRAALNVAQKNFGTDDIKVAPMLEGLAVAYVSDKKFPEAHDVLQHSLEIEKAGLPANNAQIIRTENELGWVLEQMGNTAGAKEMYQTALAGAQATLGDQDPFTLSVREALRRLSSGGSTANSGAQENFLATLKQIVEGSANHFGALKGDREDDQDGDHVWKPTVALPGAQSCDIWNYHERDMGSGYVCHYKSYPSEAAAVQDFTNMRQAVGQFLGPQWSMRKPTGDDNSVRFTNEPYGIDVRLALKYCGDNDCTLNVWIETDK